MMFVSGLLDASQIARVRRCLVLRLKEDLLRINGLVPSALLFPLFGFPRFFVLPSMLFLFFCFLICYGKLDKVNQRSWYPLGSDADIIELEPVFGVIEANGTELVRFILVRIFHGLFH